MRVGPRADRARALIQLSPGQTAPGVTSKLRRGRFGDIARCVPALFGVNPLKGRWGQPFPWVSRGWSTVSTSLAGPLTHRRVARFIGRARSRSCVSRPLSASRGSSRVIARKDGPASHRPALRPPHTRSGAAWLGGRCMVWCTYACARMVPRPLPRGVCLPPVYSSHWGPHPPTLVSGWGLKTTGRVVAKCPDPKTFWVPHRVKETVGIPVQASVPTRQGPGSRTVH